MKYSEIEKLVIDFEKIGGLQIDYTGGEIFTHKDFFNILKLTASKNIFSNIFTNGTFIDEHVIAILEEIGNIRTVFVSLDNSSPKEHDAFRGQIGAFKKTDRALRLLKQSNLNTCINLTIGNHNFSRIGEIIKTFKDEYDLPIRVAPIIEVGRGTNQTHKLTIADVCNALTLWESLTIKSQGIKRRFLKRIRRP